MDKKSLKRSESIANEMQRLAPELGLMPDAMFCLGYIHDIGLDLTSDRSRHAEVGGNTLREQNYRYWKEVRWHGIPNAEYNSPALWLLNLLDITTDEDGNRVTIQERIDELDLIRGVEASEELVELAGCIFEQIETMRLTKKMCEEIVRCGGGRDDFESFISSVRGDNNSDTHKEPEQIRQQKKPIRPTHIEYTQVLEI